MKLNSDISAVITGGASGLGAATARLLASHGVKVAIFDMNEAVGQALAGSVAKIVKLEHAWRRLDGRNDDGFQVAPFPG